MGGGPSVVVVAASGDAEQVAPAGAGRDGAVMRKLESRARAWASSVAAGRVQVTAPDRLEAAARSALGDGPVLIAWPCLARWLPEHAEGALGDLAAGCDVSIGPVFSGGLYLLAIARPRAELLALTRPPDPGPDTFGTALDAVQRSGLAVGLLRAERGLRTVSDMRAALADPLLDDEMRTLLS